MKTVAVDSRSAKIEVDDKGKRSTTQRGGPSTETKLEPLLVGLWGELGRRTSGHPRVVATQDEGASGHFHNEFAKTRRMDSN